MKSLAYFILVFRMASIRIPFIEKRKAAIILQGGDKFYCK